MTKVDTGLLEILEAQREALYALYLKSIGQRVLETELMARLDELDAILDGETEKEPMDDDLNTSTNWDEIMLDWKIDQARGEQAAMAYER